ncbi:hypothetical protein BX666DRAFT_1997332 [Dichotomocladium elegans]|nr:hypothetical protein BX666DRAFT_1997332 [Dichotomocladium elegans]
MAATPPPPPLEFQVDDQELPNLEIQSCKVDDNFIPQVYRRQSSMIQKRRREPIFVTELPQNAYGKKKKRGNRGQPLTSLSPTILGEDEDEGATEEEISKMKNMSAKERRQLRNKISARNFRMRRKGERGR